MIPPDIEAVAILGWRLYPASRRSKAACFKNATAAATCDLNVIAGWQKEYGPCNWRVVMAGSGIWAIDVDAPGQDHAADGITALKQLVASHEALPTRPTSMSGGGGYAVFWRHSGERISGKTGVPAPGLDPRRGNLSVTIAPSIHVTTKRPYRWAPRLAPWEIEPPVAPAWLLKLVEPPPEPAYTRQAIDTSDRARRTLYRAATGVLDAAPGSRNETLNKKAYLVGRMIGAGLLGEREAIDALYGAARQTGLDHIEATATIKSGINSGVRRPMEATWQTI